MAHQNFDYNQDEDDEKSVSYHLSESNKNTIRGITPGSNDAKLMNIFQEKFKLKFKDSRILNPDGHVFSFDSIEVPDDLSEIVREKEEN